MTFVGKILVIVIMAFALLFLGLSTVVFTTHANWREAIEKTWKPKVADLNKQVTELTALRDTAKADLEKAKAEHDLQTKLNADRISKLEEEIKQRQDELRALQGQVEGAQQTAQTSLTQAESNRKEAERLREQRSEIEKVANQYKIQQTELNDKIRELERMNDTLDANTKDLRDKVARYSTLLRSNGLSDDIRSIKGLESPPLVEGAVSKVDASNRRIEITIGSDDGLVAGHELFLYRTTPRPEYLGKVQVLTVDPDQAVAKVIGNTIQGKKIQEGDIVSSSIRPRS